MTPRLRAAVLAATTATWIAAVSSCAPQPLYRTSMPPPSGTLPSSARVPPAPPPPTIEETARRTIPQEAKIREQDIRTKSQPPATTAGKETKEPQRQASVVEPAPSQPPPQPDDSSLLAKITPGTSPQRAASLRLTEEGRKILEAGDPAKALTRLEKTIVIDSTNPYAYFYLAKAQFRLGHYQESLNFLDVAESRIGSEPFWLAEIHALRGENFRAQGQPQKAEASYNQALRLNSGNRTASDALTRMQADSSATAK